jgi:Zn-dependent protease
MLDQLYILPVLLFSVIIHEIAHGWMALRLGDPTAKDLGRLTLNPVPHIDPIGSVLIPLMSLAVSGRVFIAWAKPVPVNPANFQHARRDDILVSIVGPVSNMILALACTLLFIATAQLSRHVDLSAPLVDEAFQFFLRMFAGGITLNVVLALFNMIPVPPLDGSHVVASLLPAELSAQYRRVGFFGIIAVILLMRWEPFAQAFYRTIDAVSYPFGYLIHLFA